MKTPPYDPTPSDVPLSPPCPLCGRDINHDDYQNPAEYVLIGPESHIVHAVCWWMTWTVRVEDFLMSN